MNFARPNNNNPLPPPGAAEEKEDNSMMRAKLLVTAVRENKDEEGRVVNEQVSMIAVGPNGAYPEDGSDEDNNYAKWSPSASFEITIANPNLFGKHKVDQKYYADFTLAEEAPVKQEAA